MYFNNPTYVTRKPHTAVCPDCQEEFNHGDPFGRSPGRCPNCWQTTTGWCNKCQGRFEYRIDDHRWERQSSCEPCREALVASYTKTHIGDLGVIGGIHVWGALTGNVAQVLDIKVFPKRLDPNVDVIKYTLFNPTDRGLTSYVGLDGDCRSGEFPEDRCVHYQQYLNQSIIDLNCSRMFFGGVFVPWSYFKITHPAMTIDREWDVQVGEFVIHPSKPGAIGKILNNKTDIYWVFLPLEGGHLGWKRRCPSGEGHRDRCSHFLDFLRRRGLARRSKTTDEVEIDPSCSRVERYVGDLREWSFYPFWSKRLDIWKHRPERGRLPANFSP